MPLKRSVLRRVASGFILLSLTAPQAATAARGGAAQAKRTVRFSSAYTQVYSRYDRGCKDVDLNTVSEGEDVPQLCRGFGGYWLYRTSTAYRVSLAVQDARREFTVPVVAAENETAKELEAAGVKKFGDRIEWRLANGLPFAFIVRVSYYKETNNEQTLFSPENKAGEFLFVRGLKGYESLKLEVDVAGTAYNPNEQARALADKFFEEHRR